MTRGIQVVRTESGGMYAEFNVNDTSTTLVAKKPRKKRETGSFARYRARVARELVDRMVEYLQLVQREDQPNGEPMIARTHISLADILN